VHRQATERYGEEAWRSITTPQPAESRTAFSDAP